MPKLLKLAVSMLKALFLAHSTCLRTAFGLKSYNRDVGIRLYVGTCLPGSAYWRHGDLPEFRSALP